MLVTSEFKYTFWWPKTITNDLSVTPIGGGGRGRGGGITQRQSNSVKPERAAPVDRDYRVYNVAADRTDWSFTRACARRRKQLPFPWLFSRDTYPCTCNFFFFCKNITNFRSITSSDARKNKIVCLLHPSSGRTPSVLYPVRAYVYCLENAVRPFVYYTAVGCSCAVIIH